MVTERRDHVPDRAVGPPNLRFVARSDCAFVLALMAVAAIIYLALERVM